MIEVVNKRFHVHTSDSIYIGRPSSLGNPYSSRESDHAQFTVATPAMAVEAYRHWLYDRIEKQDHWVLQALKRVGPNSKLVCWCKIPDKDRPCHGDVIKELMETKTITIQCTEGDCYSRGTWTTDCGVNITCFACSGTGKLTLQVNLD